MLPRLTKQQESFVNEYLKDGIAVAAAKRAGYAESTAQARAHEFLDHPAIAEALAMRRAEQRGEVLSQTDAAAILSAIAKASPSDLLDANGEVKVAESSDAMLAVRNMTITTKEDGTKTTRLTMVDPVRAIKELGRLLGWHEPTMPREIRHVSLTGNFLDAVQSMVASVEIPDPTVKTDIETEVLGESPRGARLPHSNSTEVSTEDTPHARAMNPTEIKVNLENVNTRDSHVSTQARMPMPRKVAMPTEVLTEVSLEDTPLDPSDPSDPSGLTAEAEVLGKSPRGASMKSICRYGDRRSQPTDVSTEVLPET